MIKLSIFFILSISIVLGVNGFDLKEYQQLINEISKNETYIKDFEANINYLLELEPNYFDYTPFNEKYRFECNTSGFPNQTARNVHELKPSDIKVIGALGDSLTAALGANALTIFGLLLENRGRSWSIGGSKYLEKSLTIPNILKKFNPNLKGYTTRSTVLIFNDDGLGLNVAVSGQEANHIPDQARRLVERMKQMKDIDFQNDWKLVTLFIGGNDLCRFCKDLNKHSPEAYINDIQQGLDILYKELPRTFVNLVEVLNVTHVKDLNRGLICNLLHKFECKCAAFPEGNQPEILKQYLDQYQNFTQYLVNSGRYDGRDDFTVVAQPFFEEFTTPLTPKGKLDFSYLAPDCFHFSTKGHAAAATGLWNNMLEPVGQKSKTWTQGDKLKCPTIDRPYFYTYKNSN